MIRVNYYYSKLIATALIKKRETLVKMIILVPGEQTLSLGLVGNNLILHLLTINVIFQNKLNLLEWKPMTTWVYQSRYTSIHRYL